MDDVGVEEDIVRHHNRSQYGHSHIDAVSVNIGNDYRRSQLRPVGFDDKYLDKVAHTDDPEKDDDDPLDSVVSLAHDEKHLDEYREQGARPKRHSEEQIEPDGPSEELRHIGGDACHDDRQP